MKCYDSQYQFGGFSNVEFDVICFLVLLAAASRLYMLTADGNNRVIIKVPNPTIQQSIFMGIGIALY